MTNNNTPLQSTSDQIHNKNCYEFLMNIRLPLNHTIPGVSEVGIVRKIQQLNQYNPKEAYGDIYARFMTHLEKSVIKKKLGAQHLDDFFISLYANDNQVLEETYQQIADLIKMQSPTSAPLEKTIQAKLKDKSRRLNRLASPDYAGSVVARMSTFIKPSFKPTLQTNIASIRKYAYHTELSGSPTELRFGTQGQTEMYRSRVNPVFARFLTAQHRLSPSTDENAITHVYFNKLAKDRDRYSIEYRFELSLTRVLTDLWRHHPNVAVITLPADKGLMSYGNITDTVKKYSKQDTYQQLLDIALETSKEKIRDFHIPSQIRDRLFGENDKEQEQLVLKNLLDASFSKMGLSKDSEMSAAQRQAVWMHFVNYEAPKYILDKLQPKTFNFSCKDAIDRGGIASAFFNLMRSFEDSSTPMTRHEFDKALHAASAGVKARGMNKHIHILWNAVDQYIRANPALSHDFNKAWLIEWRDANCPIKRASDLLERRLTECIDQLKCAGSTHTPLQRLALEILQAVQVCDRSNPKNHALFLDVVVSTYAFALDPTALDDLRKSQHYTVLIGKMNQCDAKPVGPMKRFWDYLVSQYAGKVKQPNPQYTELLNKMGQWHSVKENPRSNTDTKDPSLDSENVTRFD